MGLLDIVPCVSSQSLFVFEASSPEARKVMAERLKAVRAPLLTIKAGLNTVLPQLHADLMAGRDRLPTRDELLAALNMIYMVDGVARRHTDRLILQWSFVTEIICSDEVKALMPWLL